MRDLFVLLLLAGGVYLGLRQVGCVGAADEPPAAAAEEGALEAPVETSTDAGRGTEARGAAPEAGAGAPAATTADEKARGVVQAELNALLEGRELEDPDALRAAAGRSGRVGALATAVLDARTANPKRRWLGLSRIAADAALAPEARRKLLERIDGAARKALYAPTESVAETVRGGDSLVRLQKRFRGDHGVIVPIGVLRWLNGVSGDLIHPGEEIRAPSAPMTLRASKSGFWLRLQVGDGIVREFPIGIGRQDKTPAETFVLRRPLEHPPWKDPESGNLYHYGDPEYAIGTRWIGFEPNGPHRGLGIHGTNEPESIGTAASLGCIRLRNADVEALAELVAEGMTIEIVE
ncbi:MAG: L,D-transpeptidase family protein [Planctomycetota bacterium JB042]